jgi:hypothetical protein
MTDKPEKMEHEEFKRRKKLMRVKFKEPKLEPYFLPHED